MDMWKNHLYRNQIRAYSRVLGIPGMKYHDAAIRFSSYTVTFDSLCSKELCLPFPLPLLTSGLTPPLLTSGLTPPPIHIIGAAAFLRNSKKPGSTNTALSLFEIKKALGEIKKKNSWREKVLQQFHEFLQMFNEELSKNLLP
jgi:hypothetical protein